MSIFESNLAALKSRFPELADRIESFPAKDSVVVFKARDGSTCYGIRDGNNVAPIMDHVAPLARIQSQLDAAAKQISDFTRPVLIVGLYPGNEVLGIFDQCESNTSPHAPQQICVCVDSTIALYAFLKTWDATRVIDSPRVRLFWHEDMPQFVEHLRTHPEIPHIFTLITGANDETLNQVMPPLVQLVGDRDRETERLKAENNAYYDSISDTQLAKIIAGHDDRPPRLMMPTCSWSTFIRHCTGDTCAALNSLGWETRILNMDAMLTPYYLVRQINDFKPDVFLFIDHLRSEAESVYPRNMMFVTWIQDEMDHLHSRESGRKLSAYASDNRRDLVVGSIGLSGAGDLLSELYDYPLERLFPLHVPVNSSVFHPVSIKQEHARKYGCDMAFVSNVTTPSEEVLKGIIASPAAAGLKPDIFHAFHEHLWQRYRSNHAFTERSAFEQELAQFPELHAIIKNPDGNIQQHPLFRLLYLRLNDTIYRHAVLEWADDIGINMALYGHGWDKHPRFGKYARGSLDHDQELNLAYQTAKTCLHLNLCHGVHQRLLEILSAGGKPVVRVNAEEHRDLIISALRELMVTEPDIPQDGSRNALARWLAFYVLALCERLSGTVYPVPSGSADSIDREHVARLSELLSAQADSMFIQASTLRFHDRQSFEHVLKQSIEKHDKGSANKPSTCVKTIRHADSVSIMKRLIQRMIDLLSDTPTERQSPALESLLSLTGYDLDSLIRLIQKLLLARVTQPYPTRSIFDVHSLAGLKQAPPDIQLYTVRNSLAAGNIFSAIDCLATIDYERLSTPENRGLYARHILSVGQVESALDILERNELSGDIWLWHHIDKSNAYRCLWDLSSAVSALEKHRAIHGDQPANLTNMSLLLYLSGELDNAEHFCRLSEKCFPDNPNVSTCAADLLGRIYRDKHDMESALSSHKRAIDCSANVLRLQTWPHWTWWLFLEYARTLRMIGQCEKALEIAEDGAAVSDSPGNTCSAFADLIKFHLYSVVPALDTIQAWVDAGRRSVYPNLPYATLAYLWSAVVMKRAGHDAEAENVVNELLLTQHALEPVHRDKLVSTCKMSPWWSKSNLRDIAAAFCPCHRGHEFERTMILSEMEMIFARKT